MSQGRSLLIVGVIALLVLAIVLGTIFYLTQAFKSNSTNSSHPIVTSSSKPAASSNAEAPITTNTVTPAPSPLVTQSIDPNFKIYNGEGFQFQYPKNWGLLTCSNSKNIEFDPTNSTDQLNVRCGQAVKPITILVNSSAGCSGPAVNVGTIPVLRHTHTYNDGQKDYVWCTQLQPLLNISTRTSQNGSRATSPIDYSTQVEQLISTIHYGASS